MSRVAQFKTMIMRTGLLFCADHVKMTEIKSRTPGEEAVASMTLIFYDIELIRDGEIEQLDAISETGDTFSAIVRTSVRSNTSPILHQIPAELWNVLVEEPKTAMTSFITCTKVSRSTNGDGNSNVYLYFIGSLL